MKTSMRSVSSLAKALEERLDKVTSQRNKAEAERNALNAEISATRLDIISLTGQIEGLERENTELREGIDAAIYS